MPPQLPQPDNYHSSLDLQGFYASAWSQEGPSADDDVDTSDSELDALDLDEAPLGFIDLCYIATGQPSSDSDESILDSPVFISPRASTSLLSPRHTASYFWETQSPTLSQSSSTNQLELLLSPDPRILLLEPANMDIDEPIPSPSHSTSCESNSSFYGSPHPSPNPPVIELSSSSSESSRSSLPISASPSPRPEQRSDHREKSPSHHSHSPSPRPRRLQRSEVIDLPEKVLRALPLTPNLDNDDRCTKISRVSERKGKFWDVRYQDGSRRFVCNVDEKCLRVIKDLKGIKRHITSNIHGGNKSWDCNHRERPCGKAFGRRDARDRHVKEVPHLEPQAKKRRRDVQNAEASTSRRTL